VIDQEILVFGAQADEKPLLRAAFAGIADVRWMDMPLDADTAPLARGHRVVSSFVNDDLNAKTLTTLAEGGTVLVTQRSTGYNNIDLGAAERLGLTIARVSEYSPYSVAEFAWTLAMAVNRRVIRASRRTRDFDFRLDGLMGRDIRGMTVGVLGTGRIGTCFARIAHGFGARLLGVDVVPDANCEAWG